MKNSFAVLSATIPAFLYVTAARADVLYDSLVKSIETAEAQARVSLEHGYYAMENGRSRIIWTVDRDMKALLRFRYARKTIQEGLIDFGSPGTKFRVISNNLCSNITVRKIGVYPGGGIDESTSDYTLDPPSASCPQPRSQMEGALDDAVSLQTDPTQTFMGNVFSGSSDLHKCPTAECRGPLSTMPAGQPVYEFNAFSTDRNGATEAFKVGFLRGSSIQFPNNAGSITTADGSGIDILNAHYNLRTKSGSGNMDNLTIAADSGQLNFTNTILDLSPGSKLAFTDVSIQQREGETTVDGGTLTGTLGSRSIITLSSNNNHDSYIKITQASVTLRDLAMEFSGDKATISGKSGDLSILADSADLYLSKDFHLLLGSTSLGLVFGCPAGSPADCKPMRWSKNGDFTAIGTIPAFGTAIRGGYFNFPGQNQVTLDSGDIQTGPLNVDSRDRVTPITGSLQRADLALHAQDWQIDNNLHVGLATVKLTSQDMTLQAGDPSPTGKLNFDGKITDLTAGGVGRFPLATGSASISLTASRNLHDDLKIDDGKVLGSLNLKGGDLSVAADATFDLHNILYYKGVGKAKLSFHVEDASVLINTPSDHSENGFPSGRTVVDVSTKPLALKLLTRLGFDDTDVAVNNGKWQITDHTGMHFDIAATVPTGELVNLNVQLGSSDIGYSTVCSPHVNINTGAYVLHAIADLTLSDVDPAHPHKFSVHDITLTPDFDADVDDRHCGYIVEGICGIIGGMTTGGIGAIGAAIACGSAINKAKSDMHDKFKTMAADKLRDMKFSPTF
jgi:hypothetical protein